MKIIKSKHFKSSDAFEKWQVKYPENMVTGIVPVMNSLSTNDIRDKIESKTFWGIHITYVVNEITSLETIIGLLAGGKNFEAVKALESILEARNETK